MYHVSRFGNAIIQQVVNAAYRLLIHGGLVTSGLLLPSCANTELGLFLLVMLFAGFTCLIGPEAHCDNMVQAQRPEMNLFSFIRTADPTKVRIGERQHGEDEPRLLDTTIGRTVPLLPVAPARAPSELEASIDRLFDEGVVVIRRSSMIPLLVVKKRKTVAADVGEPSHPAKKLIDDHETPGGPTVGGKSQSAIQRLLVGAVLNAEVRGEVISTLLFVTSSVSVTSEREEGDHIDFLTGANLRTIGAPQRFVVSSNSSHHFGTYFAETEVDSLIRSSAPVMITATTVTAMASVALVIKETVTKPSLFAAASSSAGGTEPTPASFSDLTGSDLLVGDIRTVVDPDSDLQKVYVSRWNITNGSLLNDSHVCRKMVDEFAPPKFFASVCGMKHDQLFVEFNVGAARQMTLGAEVRMRAEYNIREKRKLKVEAEAAEAIRLRAKTSKLKAIEKSLCDELKSLKERNAALEEEKSLLDVKVADLAATVKVREQEAADSDAMVTTVKLQNDNLADQVTAYENFVDQLEKFQDNKMKEVNDKLEKLDADVVAMVLYLEEKFYPHLLTTIVGRRWLLTHGIGLAVAKCLNSMEYLSALGAAIGKAIEKGMQEGLSTGITHGVEGRNLTDVVAYNPSAEADYLAALHHLQSVNFSLLEELKSNKDASTETIMNLLRLEDNLADKLGLVESQPCVDQVQKIKENLANRVSALRDVFIPLSEPLSVAALTGTEGISAAIPIPAGTTTALSATFASTTVIRPISTDDYEIVHADGQGNAEDQIVGENVDGNVDPFSNVDDVDLNIQ
ncbi:hypothetical protein Tco_1507591 [Tanacetum coccineum]